MVQITGNIIADTKQLYVEEKELRRLQDDDDCHALCIEYYTAYSVQGIESLQP
jgi:hypothetical protein